MKKLLNYSLKPIITYAFIVMLLSIPAYFFIIDLIWERELDKHHYSIKKKLESRINTLISSDVPLQEMVTILNKLEPGFSLKEITAQQIPVKDSLYTTIRIDSFLQDREQFRCLKTSLIIHQKPYLLVVETNMEEIDETIAAIALITIFFLALLLTGFIILNRRLSRRVWQPFYLILDKLRSFHLDKESQVNFPKTNIVEFDELGESLEKMIDGNIASYRLQKEFAQNASHELQTPLAVVKSKLELFLQDESLNGRQLNVIEGALGSLNRVSRINKNLLLLTKIENSQFSDCDNVDMGELLRQTTDQLADYISEKGFVISQHINRAIYMEVNKSLVEIMFTNLLVNAIHHNISGGEIMVTLSRQHFVIANSGKEALQQKNLFNRFASHSSEDRGTGLGLSIIKEICNRYKWKITYDFLNNRHLFTIDF